ncbi:uncharacterized protein LOC116303735 [Actinia tenebrosa]|uniref:Uncharacterized protein LOC116303735 n=1 Tax=Actinia tenebrosa TaxID=6105 RepID=A0A6P8IQ30_ACTTE|nr:uncharacterized protein LOC116303735 [Actinia tenebrosa]
MKERWLTAKKFKLCYRCLNIGHRGKDCRSKSSCNLNGCQGTHRFHLHFQKPQESETGTKVEQKQGYTSKHTTEKNSTAPGAVLLRTVPVWLHGKDGRRMQVNAFLDDGSDTTYLRYDVAVALGLQTKEKRLKISTLTDTDVDVKSHKVTVDIESVDEQKKATICAWTLEEMCKGFQIPEWNRYKEKWDHLRDISFPKLPGRNVVDILIEADNAELTLSLEERIGEPGHAVARKTPLGWTCVGRLPEVQSQEHTAYARSYKAQVTANVCLDEDLRRIWEDDLLGV